MKNRLKGFQVEITENGSSIFTGIFNDFVEGFVNDEEYFYKEVVKNGLTTFPNVKTFWSDNQKEIVINFNLS